MTADQFDSLVADRFRKTVAVLGSKAGEYATDADRLHNFKTAADEFGGLPAEVCWGFLVKHLTSVRDMAKGVRPATAGMVDEKIGDAINYLILIEALLLEEGNGP